MEYMYSVLYNYSPFFKQVSCKLCLIHHWYYKSELRPCVFYIANAMSHHQKDK